MYRSIPLLLALLAAPVAAEHITDKLLVGLYEGPEASGQPAKILPSGTPLEVIETRSGFSKVRLGDGTTGWIDRQYITSEKPAKAQLLEIQARAGSLEGELDQAKQELQQLRSRTDDGKAGKDQAAIKRQLDEALKEIERLKRQPKGGGKDGERIAQLETELAAARTTIAGLAEGGAERLMKEAAELRSRVAKVTEILGAPLPDSVTDTESYRFHSWHLLVIGIVAIAGFVGGVVFRNHRIRRRYGGFRI